MISGIRDKLDDVMEEEQASMENIEITFSVDLIYIEYTNKSNLLKLSTILWE